MDDIISLLKTFLEKDEESERCGLILDDGTVVETDNTHPKPNKGFVIPAKAFHKYGSNITGTWHTHPNDTANLSQADHDGFRQWPNLHHYIIGIDGVRCFEVTQNLVIEVPA